MLNSKKLFTKVLAKLPTISVESVQVTGVDVAANNVVESTTSVAKSGYTALGPVGYNITGSGVSYMYCYHLFTSGNTLYYAFRNNHTTARTGVTITFYVLYVKFG